MFEVALHNSRQHTQIRRTAGPLILARAARWPALWTTIGDSQTCPDARIEIVPSQTGIALALAGCEAECRGINKVDALQNGVLHLPTSFSVGDTRFEITQPNDDVPRRALERLRTDKPNLRNKKSSATGPSPATLSRWFAALSSLNHWATSLQELYIQAARCAVEAIGLDGGIVLRRRDNEWDIAASHLPHPELGIHYDPAALDELQASPQTLFHGSAAETQSGEPAIVLSPLRNASGALVGALYGYRTVREGNSRRTIRYLEAHMIELLAGAVSDGIARIEREAETDRRRVLLEHAAAMPLPGSPRSIATDEREVTLLFADLRGSTELSSSLGPNESYELMSQVMECLTAAVIDHDGLIIDYYGDGLAAMWNAPADQSNHPELACRAAMQMLQSLPSLSSDWYEVIERELQLGIGIHTGMVHVGNTGTRHRSKYGPRGTNVNLTSRVEAATKQFELPLLVTEATAKRLSSRFVTQRVCRAQLAGIDQPTDLYSATLAVVAAGASPAWQAYGEALECFEQGNLQEAVGLLATIDPAVSEVPSHFLAEQLSEQLARQNRRRSSDRGGEALRGVISLTSK